MDKGILDLAEKIKQLASQGDDAAGFFKIKKVYFTHLSGLSEDERRLFEAIRYIQSIEETF